MNQEQTNITTGKQIRHLRTQLGMTQEELAGELNVTRQALSNWERDVNEPDLKRSSTALRTPSRSRLSSQITMSRLSTRKHGSVCRSYASSENARTAMMKWGCSLVCCSAPTAAMCCISSGIRTRTASRTVISAAATRSVPVTVRHTLSAPTF